MLRHLHDLWTLWTFATLPRVWVPAVIGGVAGGLVALAGRTLLVALWSVALSLLTSRSSPSVQAPDHAQARPLPPPPSPRRRNAR